ncbi:hypothetical protein ACFS07_31280 [Undibacterium arcticum]
MVKSRDVVVDEKLNMVIVRDSPDAIRLAEKAGCAARRAGTGGDAGSRNS